MAKSQCPFARVHLRWYDPTSYQSWTDVDVAVTKKPMIMESVGWLVKSPTADYPFYLLAGQYSPILAHPDGTEQPAQIGDYIPIPRGCMVSLERLHEKRRVKK